jgi:uncharacterized repeat protein (TIGR01451 family)
VLVGVLVAVAALAGPAAASAQPLPLAPFVDCVASVNGFSRAWFGYSNTGGNTITIEPGDNNAISPGEAFQAQPTTFAIGTFPRAFSVPFGGQFVFTSITWSLNGLIATASATSPTCDDAVTTPASTLTPTTATLNGVVTPYGEPTTYTFHWGATTAYGQSSTARSVSGTPAQPVSTQLTGLQPGTTYHFTLEASNADDGATTGQDETFTTPGSTPAPIDLSLAGAATPATVTAGHTLTYTFTATNGSATTPATGVAITDPLPGAGSLVSAHASAGTCAGDTTVVCAIGSLAPGASATVTIVISANGAAPLVNTASVSGDQPDPDSANNVATVTTPVVVAPAVHTGPMLSLSKHAVLVSGIVNPEGQATRYQVQYGTSSAYGHSTPARSAGAGTDPQLLLDMVSGLERDRTYHYRLVATSAAGTTVGADRTFRLGYRDPGNPHARTHRLR